MSVTGLELRRRLRETGGRGRKLRGLAELLSPYRWRVAAMFTALVLATAAALAPAPLAKLAIDQGIQRHDVAALDRVVVLFLISAVVYALATYAQTYLVGWVGQRALQDLRVKLFVHLQALSIGFYSRNRAGVVISRMTNDVEALDQLVEDGLATLIQSSLTLIGVVVILLVLDPHLALLTFLVLPILALGGLAFRIASADAYRLTREKIASITGYLQETLSGIRVVRAFGQEKEHIRRFRGAQRREPGGQHDHGAPQRRLLPRRRAAVGPGHRGDPGDRRDRGDQRAHLDRRGVRLHRRAEQLL